MFAKKTRSLVVLVLFVLLFAALTGVRGLAQEGNGDIHLPVVYRPNGETVPSATPTATSTSTPTATNTATSTPTATATVSPGCASFSLTGFTIGQYNRAVVSIVNDSAEDVYVTDFQLDWESAYAWAIALGYPDIRVDWFTWNGSEFYGGDDTDPPTYAAGNELLPAGGSGLWEADFDWAGEQNWAFINEFGLTEENFGFWVQLDNGCVLERPETVSLPPAPDCDAYAISDFYFGEFAHVLVDITNNDTLNTSVTSIELDWDYAEAYDELVHPIDELNTDFMNYGGQLTWGEGSGGARDYDSTTHTSVDSPETFPGSWSPELPPFASGISYTLDIDFDNEWPNFETFLLPTDFGVTFTFENGCTLLQEAVPRPLPTPDCPLISVSDFTISPDNHIEASVTNTDNIWSSILERIVLDWDYAEAISDLVVGPDDLYVDWLGWDEDYIWSNNWDEVGDFSSLTDTAVDSPEAWTGPAGLDAGDTVNFEVDFDLDLTTEYSSTLWSWGLIPEDFGVTLFFDNCIVSKSAVPRPVPTPSPLDVVLVIDISESMSWDAPAGDPMRDPAQCNAADPGGSDGFPGECHPFEEQKRAVSEFLLRVLDEPESQEIDRVAIVTYGNGWSDDPILGTYLHTADWTSSLTDTLAIVRDLKMSEPDPCFWPDGTLRTPYGPCIYYDPPDSLNFLDIYCVSCLSSLIPPPGPPDYSPKASSNIGGGLLLAGNMLASDPRPEASPVVVLIADGQASATFLEPPDDIADPTTYPLGHCPPDSVFPLCQDEDISTRHPYTDTANYDADDYARDAADYVGCDPLNPAPGCPQPGVGATIFTVGFGSGVMDNTNEANDLPYGVALLRYLAAVGDDGDPATDPCGDYWDDPSEWEEWCGNYIYVSDGDDLPMAFDHIFARLILGLFQ